MINNNYKLKWSIRTNLDGAGIVSQMVGSNYWKFRGERTAIAEYLRQKTIRQINLIQKSKEIKSIESIITIILSKEKNDKRI